MPVKTPLHRIGRLPETADPGVCAWLGCVGKPRHPATFRAEYILDTGEARTKDVCTNAAAAICGHFGIEFPPGRWPGNPQEGTAA